MQEFLFIAFLLDDFYSADMSYDSLYLSDDDEEQKNCNATDVAASDLDSAIQSLMEYFMKYKSSFSCLEDTAKLMNRMPGARVQLPVTKYRLLQEFMRSSCVDLQYHIYCERCKVYTMCVDKKDQWLCSNCYMTLKLRETNHFVYMPVANQLKQMLHKYWKNIKDFDTSIQYDDNQQSITDVYDGELLKNIMASKKNSLSLMINTDGVSLQKSNAASFWPLQIICNFLPPNLRYRNENIIVAAFSYVNRKFDMCDFFKPFAEEMMKLETEGFIVSNEYFQPIVTHAVFDLPAKAAFQKIKQFNGYYACGYCLHPGKATDKGVRYTNMAEKIEMRTHPSMLATLSNVKRHRNDENYSKNGIYGISPAIVFEYFDLVDSFAIDYMHAVTIGVVKRMINIWLSERIHSSYICKDKQELLDRRIRAIRPCRFVSRLPRSLKQRKLFKASEYRSLLLYYFPVCLKGILKSQFFHHFNLLSSSIYTLLKTSISADDLNTVEEKLNLFVEQYEKLYGESHMTMNVHLLLHITTSVKCLGPLWATSMFSFESNNATFGQSVKGRTDILSQITIKYAIDKSSRPNQSYDKESSRSEVVDVMKLLQLGTQDVQTLRENNIYVEERNKNVNVYCVFKKNGENYTSICFSSSKIV